MRQETKRAYEKRIAVLTEALGKANARSKRHYMRYRSATDQYDRLRSARRQGEEARKWAVEQAINAGQTNITKAAKQIADYVYGEDMTADNDAETS